MSGIEAAGLALAIFPIVLTALENYRETAEVIGDWWKFKRKYIKCKRDVEFYQIAFESNLKQLLLPLICDDDQVGILMSDPGGASWLEEELDTKLHERLPNAYEAYLDSVNEINGVMRKLTQELGLDKDYLDARLGSNKTGDSDGTKPELRKVSTKQSLDYQFQRIKFALSQSSREKLFTEFAKYNDRLRDLLKTADRVAAIQDNRSKDRSPTASILRQFWRYAGTLYTLLSKAFTCQCRDSHHVSLRLQHRTVANVEFDIMFVLSLISGCNNSWNWRNMRIKMLKQIKERPKAVPVQTSIKASTKSSSGGSQTTSILRKFKKTITSDSQNTISSSTTMVATIKPQKSKVGWQDAPIVDAKEASQGTSQSTEISDLCSMLHNRSHNDHNCLGVLRHDDDCYALHPADQFQGTLDAHERLTLKDLLESTSGLNLTRRQRYSVALTVASSQVQLQSTPWLKTKWDKNDILFFKDKSDPKTILIDQPRLSRDVELENSAPDEKQQLNDRSITTLGILLLELCFGRTLEAHPIRARYPQGQTNPYLDLAAALEWSEQVNEEAGPEFANAISWCLKSNCINPTNDDWRVELYENVVKPLQECHQHLL